MSAVAFVTTRDVVTVEGADVHSYLQSQLSQDISSIGGLKCQAALLLDPSGRVDALVRVTYLGLDKFEVDVDPGSGELLLARLKRFKIRVNAELSLESVPVVAIRGAGAMSYLDPTHPASRPAWWMNGKAVDVFTSEAPADLPQISADEYDALRIASGWPSMGSEITGKELAAELGVVDIAVNFGKGCYPGQELVERMDSRQATSPRTLCRLPANAEVDDAVEITSTSAEFALAFVKRSADRNALNAVPVGPQLI